MTTDPTQGQAGIGPDVASERRPSPAHRHEWHISRLSVPSRAAWCDCQAILTEDEAQAILTNYEALRELYDTTVRLDEQLGRPSHQDIERVLGIGDNVMTDFWRAFDAARAALEATNAD